MPPELIGINTGGRLGNHLFNFTWMIEMARLTGGIAINPGFAEYKDLFELPAQQEVAFWPPASSLRPDTRLICLLLNRWFLKLYIHFRITRQWRLDEAKPYLKQIPGFQRHFGFIAYDWLVTGRHADKKLGPTFARENGEADFFSEVVSNYIRTKRRTIFDSAAILPSIPPAIIDTVRNYFLPRLQFREVTNAWMSEIRCKADVVIGVAVRQGDFRTWAGGAGFVDPSLFQGLLRSFAEQMPGRRCVFALCSDETIVPEQFPGVSAVTVPRGPIIQLCTLNQCDYIIGTADSTFIQWASFLGNVPWYPVSTKTARFAPEIDKLRVFGTA